MAPADNADRAIQRLLADEDPQALERIYDRHAAGLYAYAVSLVGRDGAEDVIQDLFAAIARHRQAVSQAERLPAYLTTMVRNLAIDWSRRRPQEVAMMADAIADQAVAGQGPDDSAQVRAAVARLPAGQREVVVLHAWQGFTFAEIAEALGIGLSTAGERWQGALASLRTWLKDDHHA